MIERKRKKETYFELDNSSDLICYSIVLHIHKSFGTILFVYQSLERVFFFHDAIVVGFLFQFYIQVIQARHH